ncbi:MAG: hypothetical protein Q4F13_15040, partial [Pseudomonadota bacterium]|nr:hypothetical protein [Pseudomonadota bacterium]
MFLDAHGENKKDEKKNALLSGARAAAFQDSPQDSPARRLAVSIKKRLISPLSQAPPLNSPASAS